MPRPTVSEYIEDCWKYWRRSFDALSLFVGVVVYIAIIIGWSLQISTSQQEGINVAVAIFVLGWLPVLALIVCPYQAWKAQREEVNRLTIPKLEIVFNPQDSNYIMPLPMGGFLFRVGIKNLTMKTIDRVEVELSAMKPRDLPCVPTLLHQMNDNTVPPKHSFALDPGSPKFIDVIENYSVFPVMEITHITANKDGRLPGKHYILTVRAHGTDSDVQRQFVAEIKADAIGAERLFFYPVL